MHKLLVPYTFLDSIGTEMFIFYMLVLKFTQLCCVINCPSCRNGKSVISKMSSVYNTMRNPINTTRARTHAHIFRNLHSSRQPHPFKGQVDVCIERVEPHRRILPMVLFVNTFLKYASYMSQYRGEREDVFAESLSLSSMAQATIINKPPPLNKTKSNMTTTRITPPLVSSTAPNLSGI